MKWSCTKRNEMVKYHCPKYQGWECFLTTVVIGLIVMLVTIGIGGPWYHDCEHNDCSTQQEYGIYCDDYCWTGHAGPGGSLVVLLLFALFIALALPLCWNSTGRVARREYDDLYRYEDIYIKD